MPHAHKGLQSRPDQQMQQMPRNKLSLSLYLSLSSSSISKHRRDAAPLPVRGTLVHALLFANRRARPRGGPVRARATPQYRPVAGAFAGTAEWCARYTWRETRGGQGDIRTGRHQDRETSGQPKAVDSEDDARQSSIFSPRVCLGDGAVYSQQMSVAGASWYQLVRPDQCGAESRNGGRGAQPVL